MNTLTAADVVEVIAEALPRTRAGKASGYRYTAVMADGTREVVRQKATRLYANAFMSKWTSNGSARSAPAEFFTFGKKASPYVEVVLGTYPVRLA
jgi:hypothetical protein